MKRTHCFIILTLIGITSSEVHLWEGSFGSEMRIESEAESVAEVSLSCFQNGMEVGVTPKEKGFSGVVYPRGSFLDTSCHLTTSSTSEGHPTPDGSEQQLMATLLFNGSCHIKNESGVWTMVLVVQHDPDLITPGDAAFRFECDMRQSVREVKVSTGIGVSEGDEGMSSRITMVDADPNEGGTNEGKNNDIGEEKIPHSASSSTSKVIFNPSIVRRREEL